MSQSNIDVIIVTRNRPEKLIRCVSFILTNSYLPSRLIIVDGSDETQINFKDQILSLCKRYNLTINYFLLKNNNIAHARNLGIKLVRNKYFAFIDDDEIVPQNWIFMINKLFKTYPQVKVISGPKKIYKTHNYWNLVWEKIEEGTYKQISFTKYVTAGNSVYKTEFIKKNHLLFDENFPGNTSEDAIMSHKIHSLSAKMLFHKNLYIYHDFRSSFSAFTKQWFSYGRSTHYFHEKYLLQKKFSYRLARLTNLIRLFVSVLKLIYRPYQLKRISFGLFIKDISFICGYLYSFFYRKQSMC